MKGRVSMSTADIRREVENMLADTDARIAEAEAKHSSAALEARVEAAGRLAVLKHQRDVLKRRLAEVQGAEKGHDALFQWLKEDLFNINMNLDKVITRD